MATPQRRRGTASFVVDVVEDKSVMELLRVHVKYAAGACRILSSETPCDQRFRLITLAGFPFWGRLRQN